MQKMKRFVYYCEKQQLQTLPAKWQYLYICPCNCPEIRYNYYYEGQLIALAVYGLWQFVEIGRFV